MFGIASRSVVALELAAAWLLAGLSGFASILGPVGSREEFGSLSQWGHFFAVLSLFPLSFLALGYVRGAVSEFVAHFDAAWLSAGTCILVVLGFTIVSVFGANEAWGVRSMDVAACSVAIPFVHLLIAGSVSPPNTSLERTRGR